MDELPLYPLDERDRVAAAAMDSVEYSLLSSRRERRLFVNRARSTVQDPVVGQCYRRAKYVSVDGGYNERVLFKVRVAKRGGQGAIDLEYLCIECGSRMSTHSVIAVCSTCRPRARSRRDLTVEESLVTSVMIAVARVRVPVAARAEDHMKWMINRVAGYRFAALRGGHDLRTSAPLIRHVELATHRSTKELCGQSSVVVQAFTGDVPLANRYNYCRAIQTVISNEQEKGRSLDYFHNKQDRAEVDRIISSWSEFAPDYSVRLRRVVRGCVLTRQLNASSSDGEICSKLESYVKRFARFSGVEEQFLSAAFDAITSDTASSDITGDVFVCSNAHELREPTTTLFLGLDFAFHRVLVVRNGRDALEHAFERLCLYEPLHEAIQRIAFVERIATFAVGSGNKSTQTYRVCEKLKLLIQHSGYGDLANIVCPRAPDGWSGGGPSNTQVYSLLAETRLLLGRLDGHVCEPASKRQFVCNDGVAIDGVNAAIAHPAFGEAWRVIVVPVAWKSAASSTTGSGLVHELMCCIGSLEVERIVAMYYATCTFLNGFPASLVEVHTLYEKLRIHIVHQTTRHLSSSDGVIPQWTNEVNTLSYLRSILFHVVDAHRVGAGHEPLWHILPRCHGVPSVTALLARTSPLRLPPPPKDDDFFEAFARVLFAGESTKDAASVYRDGFDWLFSVEKLRRIFAAIQV